MNKKYFKKISGLLTYSFIGSVLQSIIMPLIVLPFFAKSLTKADFGQLTVILAGVNYMTTVIGGNLNITVFRWHKDFSTSERPNFFGKILWFNIFISVMIVSIFTIFYTDVALKLNLSLNLSQGFPFIAIMGISSVGAILVAMVSGHLLFKNVMIANIALFIGALSPIFCYLYLSSIYWYYGFIIGPLFYVMYLFIFLLKNNLLNLKNIPDVKLIKKILKEISLWIIAGILINIVLYGDRWVMASFGIGFESIGVYAIAVQANMVFLFFIQQISLVATPLISNLETIDQFSYGATKKINMALFFLVSGVLIGGVLVGPLFIKILYGEQYWEEAKWPFYILLGGTSLYPLQVISRGFLIRFHKPMTTLILHLISTVMYFFLVWSFSADWSIDNFAISRSLSVAILSIGIYIVVYLPLLKKSISEHKKY